MPGDGPPVPADRLHPSRPWLAVSAAVLSEGRVLLVRRARPPMADLFTLPGGAVEVGETLAEAVVREVREETALDVAPIALAGHREIIQRDADGRTVRHFVVLSYAARLLSGALELDAELAEARWLEPSAIATLATTEGLADIVTAAVRIVRAQD